MVAIYTNYTLVTQRVQSLMSGILDSTGAAVGNLISEGNRTKIFEVYRELFIIRKTKCSAILERSVHQQKTKRPHKNTIFTTSNEE